MRDFALAVATALAFASPLTAIADSSLDPARFRVGAALRSISPAVASEPAAQSTQPAGYGRCNTKKFDCPMTRSRQVADSQLPDGGDLAVRALFVGDAEGKSGVLTASVDVQGWFAGYQHGEGLGITEVRAEVAAALADTGLDVTQANIIVNANHCHACPGIVGIWAATNVDYLRFVYEQTKAALLEAVAAARPATLRWASRDSAFLNCVTVGQENVNEGWELDGVLGVLQARDATTDEVIVTLASVPVHENILTGTQLGVLSSGYFGSASRWMAKEFGGVGIAQAGTLGDQTSPMQFDSRRLADDPRGTPDAPGQDYGYPQGFDTVDRFGALVGNLVEEALRRDSHPIHDATVAAAETYALIPVTNPLIGALGVTGPVVGYDESIDGCWVGCFRSLDRSILPPYVVGPAIGEWFTALRIGPVAMVSEPGEAFPHITSAIRRSIPGAELVMAAGNAQDQLGYFYEPWAFPQTLYYSVDHWYFNVSQALAETTIQAHFANATLLGFETLPTVADPTPNDHLRIFEAGVQFLVYPNAEGGPEGPAVSGTEIALPVGIYTRNARSRNYGIPGERITRNAAILVDYGDGTPIEAFDPENYSEEENFRRVQWHIFPKPGDYLVRAIMPGTDAYWEMNVHIEDAHHVTATANYPQPNAAAQAQKAVLNGAASQGIAAP